MSSAKRTVQYATGNCIAQYSTVFHTLYVFDNTVPGTVQYRYFPLISTQQDCTVLQHTTVQ